MVISSERITIVKLWFVPQPTVLCIVIFIIFGSMYVLIYCPNIGQRLAKNFLLLYPCGGEGRGVGAILLYHHMKLHH